jgi:hypothetical protein
LERDDRGFELAGEPLKAAELWTFDGSTEGFTAVGGRISPAAGQGISAGSEAPPSTSGARAVMSSGDWA